MPIQTSRITTDTNGDLTIAPNGTGETKVTSVDVTRVDGGTTEDTPVAVAQDGTVKKTDLSTLPTVLAENLVPTDLIAVQKGNGDFYHIDASTLVGGGGGVEPIDPPTNATLIINPLAGSGSGTSGDPWVLSPITVNTPGGTGQTVEEFSVINAPPNAILFITFTDNAGGRFRDLLKVSDDNGQIAPFKLTYVDDPSSTAQTVFVGKVRFGPSSEYATWTVTQKVPTQGTDFLGSDRLTPAPNASPAIVDFTADHKFGEGTGIWDDGPTTISASGDIKFKVNNGVYNKGPASVVNNDSVVVAYDQAVVDAAAEGDTINGELTGTSGTYSFVMVKDITPDVPSLGSKTGVLAGSKQESDIVIPTGFNATISVSAGVAAPNEMTNIEASIEGGSFVSLPTTMYPGQMLQIRGDCGSADLTEYTAHVQVGNTEAIFSVKTGVAANPGIRKPTIVYPVTSTSLDQILRSDAYTPTGAGTGSHAESDWEIYKSRASGYANIFTNSARVRSSSSITNRISWTPSQFIGVWDLDRNELLSTETRLSTLGGSPLAVVDDSNSTFFYAGRDGSNVAAAYTPLADNSGEGTIYSQVEVLGGVDSDYPRARLVIVDDLDQRHTFDEKDAAWDNPQTFTANYSGPYKAIFIEQIQTAPGGESYKGSAMYSITIDGIELSDAGASGKLGGSCFIWCPRPTAGTAPPPGGCTVGVFVSSGPDTGARGELVTINVGDYQNQTHPHELVLSNCNATMLSLVDNEVSYTIKNMNQPLEYGRPSSYPPSLTQHQLVFSDYNATGVNLTTNTYNFDRGSKHYAVVRYRSDNGTESDWSDYKYVVFGN